MSTAFGTPTRTTRHNDIHDDDVVATSAGALSDAGSEAPQIHTPFRALPPLIWMLRVAPTAKADRSLNTVSS